jgi:hypothetical protein
VGVTQASVREHRPEHLPRDALCAVHHHIVPPPGGAPQRGALGVLVVQHLVRAKAPDETEVARAAGGRDVVAGQPGHLHGEVADAAVTSTFLGAVTAAIGRQAASALSETPTPRRTRRARHRSEMVVDRLE